MENQGDRGIGIAAWIFSIAGLILITVTGYYLIEVKDIKDNWEQSKGMVFSLIVDPAEGGAAPIISYVWEEDTLAYTSDVFRSPPDFLIEDSLAIFINPQVPQQIAIDDFSHLYFFPMILGVLGIILVLIGFGILFFSNRI